MSPLPFPAPYHEHLRLDRADTNASLLFDKGMDRYTAGSWSIPSGTGQGKPAFLYAFRAAYTSPQSSARRSFFDSFTLRRRTALTALGAARVPFRTRQPLVVGLGLPSPLETGFLFDRLTGTPYLPGSSVKGVFRAMAEAIAAGELSESRGENAKSYWKENLEAVFGPPTTDAAKARGNVTFYDAYPVSWPRLEVDVLTPHYRDTYGDDPDRPTIPPSDTQDPVPVYFLTVASGTRFDFYWRDERAAAVEDDETQLRALALDALDWLGAGGKTSQGYGVMDLDTAAWEEIQEAEAAEALERADAALPELEREAVALCRTSPDVPRCTMLYKAVIEMPAWEGERLREAAEVLRRWMEEDKLWKEISHAKRPERDTPHQRTLSVLTFLDPLPDTSA